MDLHRFRDRLAQLFQEMEDDIVPAYVRPLESDVGSAEGAETHQCKVIPLADREDERGEPTVLIPVDFLESKDAFLLQADLPGVKRQDVKASIQGGVLTISAARPHAPDGFRYVRRECGGSKLTRSLKLPNTIDRSGIQVKLEDGVLTVRLPKLREECEGAPGVDLKIE